MRFEQKHFFIIGMVCFGLIGGLNLLNILVFTEKFTPIELIIEVIRAVFNFAVAYFMYYLLKSTSYAPGTEINEDAIDEFLKNDSKGRNNKNN